MTKRVHPIFLAMLMAAAVTPPAGADWTAQWSNGHQIRSESGDFALKLGGRIQADWTVADLDDELGTMGDGFEFRRARLFFSGTIYERVSFKAQYDFAGGDADFKDVWIALDNDWGDLKFGHFKEPFSLEEQTSSKYITFLERPLPVEAFSPGRNSGVGISGSAGDAVNWGVGAFYDSDAFGESVSDDDTDVTARIGWRPVYEADASMLHLGLAGSIQQRGKELRFRSRPENHLAGRFVDTGGFAVDGATLLGGEVAGAFGPLWFAGEYVQSDVDAAGMPDPTFEGAYAAVGWFVTGEHRPFKTSSGSWNRVKPATSFGRGGGGWEIAVRYSTLDLSDAGLTGGEQDNVTVGLNWYLNPATRLMIDYTNADVDPAGSADFLGVRWQVDF